ncbi:tRNA (uridine(54)-C5)-methyltransferase TrmA [Gilvimarinus sp. DA14]|uniref:tRNA (uridine(54)-C5)-methyltransferase TrmA n=1 Tax=Gilvimarinus sp. DA14 TaxID=2956798 RepID=UPI0020B72EC1|nr:tRNA (uridine(54)-C5)-methyltransferase TrmA [Gilvimarinus sp. DA14]UTF60722.1 tRNA (uridine(54)-C5)-methyltransferase TrmA [Gilvimarinus sp. DA14]
MTQALNSEAYAEQLQQKIQYIESLFAQFALPALEVFDSPASGFRMRAEFKIWHEGTRADYAMYRQGEYKKPYTIKEFPQGYATIGRLMPPLLEAINNSELLRRKLFQVEFLTTLSGEALVTLIYHKKLDEQWRLQAERLQQQLNIKLIGRSRKQKLVLSEDFVTETLSVNDRLYHYQQIESSFTQPNARVCEKMLSWAVGKSENLGGDLLELYCGNGNFTLPLSQNFNRVVATELAKSSVNSAQYNLALNQIDNVSLARMSSEEFSQALDKVRPFRRLSHIDLDAHNFSTIFVDPPRAGLDPHTTEICQRFENILYISCNPDTLKRDLQELTKSHSIQAFALFDQFPFTHHIECGALLQRR